jgi:hypothetical protein
MRDRVHLLQSGNIDAILARDYGPRYLDFNNAVTQYKAFRATPKVVGTYSPSQTTGGPDAALMKFSAARRTAQSMNGAVDERRCRRTSRATQGVAASLFAPDPRLRRQTP